MSELSISIYRYQPDVSGAKPYMQDYSVQIPEGKELMVLDVLALVKKQDPTLAYRRSCREGVCGSDGMNINGKNALACVTSIAGLSQPLRIRPLPGMPVIRDLIVDMDQFFKQYEKAKPYLRNEEPAPITGERLQSPQDREKLDGLYECILCGCCTSSCPSSWWNPEKFMGPAALLQAARFVADSRESPSSKRERLEALSDPFSAFRCRSIMNCASVCPKGLNPTEAIASLRDEMLREGGV